jgi:curved DNA-binding protein CbpA
VRCAAARQSADAADEGEDFFDVLESTPADGPETVRENYRRLQKRLHPDVAGSSKDAIARSAALNVAYETLNDATKRAAYEAGTGAPRRSGARKRAAPARREGLVGPLRQERLLATLLPRRAAGTERLVRHLSRLLATQLLCTPC